VIFHKVNNWKHVNKLGFVNISDVFVFNNTALKIGMNQDHLYDDIGNISDSHGDWNVEDSGEENIRIGDWSNNIIDSNSNDSNH